MNNNEYQMNKSQKVLDMPSVDLQDFAASVLHCAACSAQELG